MIDPASQTNKLELEIDAVIADAKRAVLPGAVGDSAERDRSLNLNPSVLGIEHTVPDASPLAVAIDGPGLFVLQDGGRRLYGRLGDFRVDEHGALVDGRGRAVVGFRVNTLEQPVSGALPLQVDPADVASRRFAEYAIDEHGIFAGVVRRVDARTGQTAQTSVPIGRVTLAVFPAPERLARDGDATLRATAAAGLPSIFGPGDANMGTLRPHALESGSVDVAADLKKLWTLRQLAEAQATLAAANDALARTALGLVR